MWLGIVWFFHAIVTSGKTCKRVFWAISKDLARNMWKLPEWTIQGTHPKKQHYSRGLFTRKEQKRKWKERFRRDILVFQFWVSQVGQDRTGRNGLGVMGGFQRKSLDPPSNKKSGFAPFSLKGVEHVIPPPRGVVLNSTYWIKTLIASWFNLRSRLRSLNWLRHLNWFPMRKLQEALTKAANASKYTIKAERPNFYAEQICLSIGWLLPVLSRK